MFLEGYLNLRTVRYHENIANKYFTVVLNNTKKNIYEKKFVKYGGKIGLRMFADKLMHLKIVGSLFVSIFSFFASCDLLLKK